MERDMDRAVERQIREVLAGEQFGVLATIFAGRLHTATIHFAETPDLELVHAIQPTSLKAVLAAANPRVAFQVDNRGILLESRERFARISFEGALRAVPDNDPEYESFRHIFAAKLPVGRRLLARPEIGLYVLRPRLIRFAVGGAPAEEFALRWDDGAPPAVMDEDHAWATRRTRGHDEAGSTRERDTEAGASVDA